MGLSCQGYLKKNDILSRFDTVHECDGWRDGWTETGQSLVPHLSPVSSGEKLVSTTYF